MFEFQIVRGIDSEVQKKLNQWRHQYTLKIHSMEVVDKEVVILLIRTPKGE
jgi:uncharacterized protein YxjI